MARWLVVRLLDRDGATYHFTYTLVTGYISPFPFIPKASAYDIDCWKQGSPWAQPYSGYMLSSVNPLSLQELFVSFLQVVPIIFAFLEFWQLDFPYSTLEKAYNEFLRTPGHHI